MRTLYHYWLCPNARKVRLIMAEKKLDFELELEKTWENRPDFVSMNPAGVVPVLVELNGNILCDHTTITEYLEEAYPEYPLLGSDLIKRAEVRRLVSWFDVKFNREVTHNLVFEKSMKRLIPGSRGPDSTAIRTGKARMHNHMDYIANLVDRRKWLAGDQMSVADLAAAAHLSAVDYVDDVPWDKYEPAKEWYARIKSRPSFRALLSDRVPGIRPPAHYTNLDF